MFLSSSPVQSLVLYMQHVEWFGLLDGKTVNDCYWYLLTPGSIRYT